MITNINERANQKKKKYVADGDTSIRIGFFLLLKLSISSNNWIVQFIPAEKEHEEEEEALSTKLQTQNLNTFRRIYSHTYGWVGTKKRISISSKTRHETFPIKRKGVLRMVWMRESGQNEFVAWRSCSILFLFPIVMPCVERVKIVGENVFGMLV